jgi:glycosyltransferase involved in cell wall biosynthesis
MSHSDPAKGADIVVFTDFTSPYQVELFNKIEELSPGRLEVYYRKSRSSFRGWSPSAIRHEGVMMDVDDSSLVRAGERFKAARLAVFNFYDDSRALRLLDARAKLDLPWSFWGERPGYYSLLLGRLRRLWTLRWLHRTKAPIWGKGRMAVDAYREEFGSYRQYVNLPYFSDLDRFTKAAASRSAAHSADERVVLFSGSLINRKGVDMLAGAVAELFRNGERRLKLKIMGRGPLEHELRCMLGKWRSQVEFPGFQDWEALPAVYASADVLCAPSRHDGWGLIVPEALAAGLPVISTLQTGAAVEFIEHGTNGWLFDAHEPAGLLHALREVAALDAPALARMSAAALESVAHHSLQDGAVRFLRAAEDAIQGW